jgi:antitoxin component of MazEF toxin-antitoxin module
MPQDESTQVVESGKAGIDPDNVERVLEAQFPLFRNPAMGDYLSYRACGFSVREACSLANIAQGTVQRWRRSDKDFARWEGEWLPHLQTNLAAIVTKAQWYRNLLWGMNLDGKILKKAALSRGALTPEEWKYLATARKQYDPQGLLALERATAPEGPSEEGDTFNIDKAVIVRVDGQEITSEEGKRVAARTLLEQFKSNEKYREHPEVVNNEPEVLEGEVVGGNGSTPD